MLFAYRTLALVLSGSASAESLLFLNPQTAVLTASPCRTRCQPVPLQRGVINNSSWRVVGTISLAPSFLRCLVGAGRWAQTSCR